MQNETLDPNSFGAVAGASSRNSQAEYSLSPDVQSPPHLDLPRDQRCHQSFRKDLIRKDLMEGTNFGSLHSRVWSPLSDHSRFGWDCHGLPVEYEIDKKLSIKVSTTADLQHGT